MWRYFEFTSKSIFSIFSNADGDLHVRLGFAAGDIPKLPLNLVLLKSCDVLGVFWGAWTTRDPQGHRANTAQLLNWAAEGKLSSHVHAVYPLREGPAALKAIAARQVMGKVILKP